MKIKKNKANQNIRKKTRKNIKNNIIKYRK